MIGGALSTNVLKFLKSTRKRYTISGSFGLGSFCAWFEFSVGSGSIVSIDPDDSDPSSGRPTTPTSRFLRSC